MRIITCHPLRYHAARHRVTAGAMACAAVAIAFLMPARSAAQSVWELTPYKIHTLVATGDGSGLTERRQRELMREIGDRAQAVVGAAWEMSLQAAGPQLRARMLADLAGVSLDDLPAGWKELDKVFLLSVTNDRGGYRVEALELDVRTQMWGSRRSGLVYHASRLPREAFAALIKTFAPLATVEPGEGKNAILRLRAARRPPRDATLVWSRKSDVFGVVLRQTNRDGTLRGIREIPWTVLRVETVADAHIDCQVISGLRSPLSRRRRGRVEQLALGVRPPGRSTWLTLQSRVAPKRPLAGYEVISLAADPASAYRLGRTDYRGQIEIPPGADPYRVLLVKSGGELLARLPLVPGASPTLVAEVADDEMRLEVEGFVTGLQENLVDLVARREVLVTRVRARIAAGELDEARVLIEQIRQLRTREQFAQILRQQRPRFSTSDRAVQSKIDKLFADTEALLTQYLDPAQIRQLEAELLSAGRGTTGG